MVRAEVLRREPRVCESTAKRPAPRRVGSIPLSDGVAERPVLFQDLSLVVLQPVVMNGAV